MVELDTKERESFQKEITETLKNEELSKMLKERLEKEDVNMIFSLDEDEKIIATISNYEQKIEEKGKEIKNDQNIPKLSTWEKFKKAFCNVCKDTFDTVFKIFLKKKFNINNSVYNDSRDGITATIKGDFMKATTKTSDAILGSIKSISGDTKKIIKSAKNAIIKEAFDWSK